MTSATLKENLGTFEQQNEYMRNATILHFKNGTILQSYNTDIAFKIDGKVYLTDAWDYSTTTGKHRNAYLGETKADTQKKLDDGTYTLITS